MAATNSRSFDEMEEFKYSSKKDYERALQKILRKKMEIEATTCLDGETDVVLRELDRDYEDLMEEYLRFSADE